METQQWQCQPAERLTGDYSVKSRRGGDRAIRRQSEEVNGGRACPIRERLMLLFGLGEQWGGGESERWNTWRWGRFDWRKKKTSLDSAQTEDRDTRCRGIVPLIRAQCSARDNQPNYSISNIAYYLHASKHRSLPLLITAVNKANAIFLCFLSAETQSLILTKGVGRESARAETTLARFLQAGLSHGSRMSVIHPCGCS